MWEAEAAAAQARAWGVVLAVDPAREPVPAGPGRVPAPARARRDARRSAPSRSSASCARSGARRDVFAILETDTALKEAKRLRAARAEPARRSRRWAAARRLVRPRGGIVVRDDEQE